jgi:hypothetical protein
VPSGVVLAVGVEECLDGGARGCRAGAGEGAEGRVEQLRVGERELQVGNGVSRELGSGGWVALKGAGRAS